MTIEELKAKYEAEIAEMKEKHKKEIEKVKDSDVIKEVKKTYDDEIKKLKDENEKNKQEYEKKITDLRAEHILQIKNMLLGRKQIDEDDEQSEEEKFIESEIKRIKERY